MKSTIRVVICLVMICLSLTMGFFTFLSFARATPEAPIVSDRYVLGESGGFLAVYADGDRREPVTITNIPTSRLRQADLAEVKAGVICGSEGELLQILEDLGS